MRLIRRALLTALAIGLGLPLATATQEPPSEAPPDLMVYVGKGCPHCERALEWLEGFRRTHPELDMDVADVVVDRVAVERLSRLSREQGFGGITVPTFVIRGETVEVGFDAEETTGRMLERLLLGGGETPTGRDAGSTPVGSLARPSVAVPLVGEVYLDQVGLPVFTAFMGLLDGFNPCAMWMLLFLLSVLVHVESRARMAAIGGVFVLVSGVVYYAFMAAWLNVFLLLGMARWIQVGLGGLALVLGGLNVKDFVGLGRGPSLGIPEAAKPSVYARVRKIVSAERLGPALGTVIVLALLVNTVELLCTAGLPALYTRILTLRELPTWTYHGYLLLYNVFYMLDDAMILVVAVVTLGHHRLQAKEARGLKLLSGLVMLGLGLLLIIEPGWLLR